MRRPRRWRRSKILAPVPRFSARTILIPEVVLPFLEGLSDMHPPSPRWKR